MRGNCGYGGLTLRVLVMLLLACPVFLHAVPVITSITPATVAAGGPGFQLNIFGSGFFATQTVLVNGVGRGSGFQIPNLQSAASQ